MSLLIRNGRILNPAEQRDEVADLLVEGSLIAGIAPVINEKADRVIDASGCFVMPGLIDLHVHLRDPGQTYKEDIESGGAAAANGGYTTICCMPNTTPAVDCPEVVSYILNKAKAKSPVHILPVGALTKGMRGEEPVDVAALKEAGVCALSEDGKSVMDSYVCREAMRGAARTGLPVFAHCEDIRLMHGGVLNQGKASEKYGVCGISNAVEDIIAARDILLSKETGARLHLCHCSTKDSVKMVGIAKSSGVNVTAEVCPHHFSLCEDDISRADANYKMNPPLRSKKDREALIKGLSEDVIDVISTDHAPHSAEEKARSLTAAPFGITGLETAVSLVVTYLLAPGYLTPMQVAKKMSFNPARILGIPKGDLSEGKIADITIIDPDITYTVDAGKFRSKGKNTPFDGMRVRGKAVHTIVDGVVVK